MDDGHGKLTFGHGATPTPEAANDVSHCQEFIELHVIAKNVQSIRDPSRFDDFLAEIDTCDFDILCISETWRGDDSESWTTTLGHKLFFSGGVNPLRCWNWYWAKACFGNVSCPFSRFF